MKVKLLFFLSTVFLFSLTQAQNMSGQWTGGFGSAGSLWGGNTEYVLELDVRGQEVEGHSYTYFMIMGKRCYVICKLKGNYDPGSKSIEVTEVAKVKSNTPPDFRDCLQTHSLTFFKQGEKEVLRGKWKGARESDNCGTGITELERKALVRIAPQKSEPDLAKTEKKEETKIVTAKPSTPAKQPQKSTVKSTTAPKTNKPAAGNKTTTVKKPVQSASKPLAKAKEPEKKPLTTHVIEKPTAPQKEKTITEQPKSNIRVQGFGANKLERSKHLIKTIDVPQNEFRVDLYDNGQIDGDTVTLYFNGKQMISKQKLSTAPITLKIKLDQTRNDNDLVMIAENLGSIPPNTALMVVTVGDKRYEVNITSTEQTNGTVRFRLKE